MNHDILYKINKITDKYCDECAVQEIIKKEHGFQNSQDYCLKLCKVGKQIQELGTMLDKKGVPSKSKKAINLTLSAYESLKKQEVKDYEICRMYGIGTTTLHRRKIEWGILPLPKRNETDYFRLRERNYTDADISKAWGIGTTTLRALKKKWRRQNDKRS